MITIVAVIQIGANTHNHGQSILSKSLRAIKRIVNAPINPNPSDEDEFDVFLIILFGI